MKFKQVAAIMLISATTAVGSMWAYNKISQKRYLCLPVAGIF